MCLSQFMVWKLATAADESNSRRNMILSVKCRVCMRVSGPEVFRVGGLGAVDVDMLGGLMSGVTSGFVAEISLRRELRLDLSFDAETLLLSLGALVSFGSKVI